jgi:hypothetical protein
LRPVAAESDLASNCEIDREVTWFMSPIRNSDAGADGAYYRRLDVGPAASSAEIVRAYRRLALAVHPDAHPDDPDAAKRFREITEAYEVLGDPVRREAYDGIMPSRRIPVRWAHSAGARFEARSKSEAQPSVPLTVLGASKSQRLGDVPLRVGPVHIGPPSGTDERIARPTILFIESLSSWWRR